MNDEPATVPDLVRWAQQAAEQAGFAMSCENRTGALLATLAASKPDGRFLELGTGTGVGTAWLLAGMTRHAHLVTVEADPATATLARQILGGEKRVSLVTADADAWLDIYSGPASTWRSLIAVLANSTAAPTCSTISRWAACTSATTCCRSRPGRKITNRGWILSSLTSPPSPDSRPH